MANNSVVNSVSTTSGYGIVPGSVVSPVQSTIANQNGLDVGAVRANETPTSYNFSSSGSEMVEKNLSSFRKKGSISGLIKLLMIIILPIVITLGAGLVYVTNAQETEYQASKNVIMTIPMKKVNWADLGVVFEPVATMKIKVKSGYEDWEFLLDSGAVVSSLPRDWADKMGKDLSMMKRSTFRGFGNSRSFAYQGEMTVKMGENDVNIPVVFTEAAGTKSLLGRKGFFENFNVFFNSDEKRIEIRE